MSECQKTLILGKQTMYLQSEACLDRLRNEIKRHAKAELKQGIGSHALLSYFHSIKEAMSGVLLVYAI